MNKEFKRMQELAGTPAKKESLNEHYIAGGIVGVGAINTINPRKKTDYEMAFEHFIGEGYDNEYGVDIEEEKKEEPVEEGLKLDPNMTVEEFMEKLLGPDYERKPQEKRDMVSKVYDELKRVNSIKEIKAEDLYKEFEENNLLDDRREYDIEDFTSAYPNLSKKEAEKLEKMLK